MKERPRHKVESAADEVVYGPDTVVEDKVVDGLDAVVHNVLPAGGDEVGEGADGVHGAVGHGHGRAAHGVRRLHSHAPCHTHRFLNIITLTRVILKDVKDVLKVQKGLVYCDRTTFSGVIYAFKAYELHAFSSCVNPISNISSKTTKVIDDPFFEVDSLRPLIAPAVILNNF